MAGAKVRRVADAQGLKTEEISTKTLSQLRSIPDSDLPAVLSRLVSEGGSYRTATRLAQEWKQEQEQKAYGQKPFFTPEPTSSVSSKEEDPVVETQQIQDAEESTADEFEIIENTSATNAEEDTEEESATESRQMPDAFFIQTQTEPSMQQALEFLANKAKAIAKAEPSTKICIKHHGRVYPITALEYRPGEDKIVCYSDEAEARVID